MRAEKVDRKVKRSFLGEGANETYRKGQMISLDPSRAASYDAQGLTEVPKGAPTKAKAAASAEATKADRAAAKKAKARGGAKTAKASETKETPKDGAANATTATANK